MAIKKTLSIAIVNYNTSEFLKRCLSSLQKSQLEDLTYEIIVVDNHSSPKDKINEVKKQFPEIYLIKNSQNVGFAKANNVALNLAKSKYILLLNPDTEVLPDTLGEMVSFMENNPECGVSTCRVELENGQIDDACHRGFPTPWNAFCHFTGLGKIFPQSLVFNGYHLGYRNLDKVHEIDSCTGAFLMTRKKIGEAVNWLDEDYFWYGEDLDYCYRVKEKGGKVFYNPNTRIIHHKGVASGIKNHSSRISTSDRATRIKATQARFAVMRIFYEKHYKNKYPAFLQELVFFGIKIKEYLSLFKYKYF